MVFHYFPPYLDSLTDKTTMVANETKSHAQNVSGLKDGEGNCSKGGFLLVSRIWNSIQYSGWNFSYQAPKAGSTRPALIISGPIEAVQWRKHRGSTLEINGSFNWGETLKKEGNTPSIQRKEARDSSMVQTSPAQQWSPRPLNVLQYMNITKRTVYS